MGTKVMPKALTAYCSSVACGGLYEMKPKPNAVRGDIMCRDCGWALFWQHPDAVGIELKGRAAHKFSKSIYTRADMRDLE
jgi:hypothetical protein